MLRARVDRHKCIGAGNCITVAPTAFDWLKGDLGKADVVDPDSVEEELLRAAAVSCPTDAIVIEEVEELLPWQLRGKAGPERRVLKTFMFTDIVKSTNLAEAMGDDAWLELLRWHDETLRAVFAAHSGEEVGTTGRRVLRRLRQPRRGADVRRRHPAPTRRSPQAARLRAAGSHRAARLRRRRRWRDDFRGKGVHEASRIAALGEGGEIVASKDTVGADAAVPGNGAADRDAQGDLRAGGGRLDRLALSAVYSPGSAPMPCVLARSCSGSCAMPANSQIAVRSRSQCQSTTPSPAASAHAATR